MTIFKLPPKELFRGILWTILWAIIFYAAMLVAVFASFPTQLTGWIAFILITPIFSFVIAKLFPNKNLRFKEVIYALLLIVMFIVLIYYNDKCGNCIGKYY